LGQLISSFIYDDFVVCCYSLYYTHPYRPCPSRTEYRTHHHTGTLILHRRWLYKLSPNVASTILLFCIFTSFKQFGPN
jgi:hypothetical protein